MYVEPPSCAAMRMLPLLLESTATQPVPGGDVAEDQLLPPSVEVYTAPDASVACIFVPSADMAKLVQSAPLGKPVWL